jgi:hypothetical protein
MENLFVVLDEDERPLACFWDLFNQSFAQKKIG